MKQKIALGDFDVVYLSYDEPNATENWNNLLNWIPYAKRIHGVTGIASAHIAASKISTTSKTITIDGDCVLFRDITIHSFELDDELYNDHTLMNWPSKNIVNGLSYGNGGIKLWPTHVLSNRNTNELGKSGTPTSLDYCFGLPSQLTFHECFSKTQINSSPLQAWRAGFREGLKLSLNQGEKINETSIEKWPGGKRRLSVWMTIGADVCNGLWTILGARQGCYYANFIDWNMDQISNYCYLNEHFKMFVQDLSDTQIYNECIRLGDIIKTKFNISEPFSSEQSKLFKSFNINFDSAPQYINPGYHWVKKPNA